MGISGSVRALPLSCLKQRRRSLHTRTPSRSWLLPSASNRKSSSRKQVVAVARVRPFFNRGFPVRLLPRVTFLKRDRFNFILPHNEINTPSRFRCRHTLTSIVRVGYHVRVAVVRVVASTTKPSPSTPLLPPLPSSSRGGNPGPLSSSLGLFALSGVTVIVRASRVTVWVAPAA